MCLVQRIIERITPNYKCLSNSLLEMEIGEKKEISTYEKTIQYTTFFKSIYGKWVSIEEFEKTMYMYVCYVWKTFLPQSFKNFFPNPSKTFSPILQKLFFFSPHIFFPALRRTYWEIHCIHNSFSNSLLKMKIGEKKREYFFQFFVFL